ncbi:hypothetical protein GP486_002810 [Trichoglossum hirsutum]|uniref:Uncharacterized protein n=1 Tax=Trichoglossum hirsutum TaxID=265104 RepID=A0A9P8RRD3_9PEZI|nr:hypothetical protein GP486_002810 [Trichoglossum hirsutum]
MPPLSKLTLTFRPLHAEVEAEVEAEVKALPVLPHSGLCSAFSTSEFFQDSPWLNIPPHRRGEIVIEPLYPRGGLMGGSSSAGASTSSSSGGKLSKLAALAAARKKQAEKPASETESVRRPQSSSINLLSKLGQKSQGVSKTEVHSEQQIQAENDGAGKACNAGKYPARTRKSLDPRVPAPEPRRDIIALNARVKTEELKPEDMQAEPSPFAIAMLGRTPDARTKKKGSIAEDVFSLPYVTKGLTNFDAFKGPSPDDVVTSAQKMGKKGRGNGPGNLIRCADVL